MELSKLVICTNILINSTRKILLINKQCQILSSHYSLESTQLSSATILIVLNSMQGLYKMTALEDNTMVETDDKSTIFDWKHTPKRKRKQKMMLVLKNSPPCIYLSSTNFDHCKIFWYQNAVQIYVQFHPQNKKLY